LNKKSLDLVHVIVEQSGFEGRDADNKNRSSNSRFSVQIPGPFP
jgi:hypothetical protein